MKTILFLCLSFYLVLNLISALDTFNAQLQQQANDESNVYHPASHLQGLAYQEQQVHSQNATIPHQYDDMINNTNNRVVQKNRSRLQRGKYQLQETLQNTTPVHPLINNRDIHPRFRAWPPAFTNKRAELSLSKITSAISNSNISSIQKNNTQLNQSPLLADTNVIVNTTKSSGLLQIFTPKPQLRERISFADYYFQRHLRSLFGHQHDKTPSPTRSNIKTGLR